MPKKIKENVKTINRMRLKFELNLTQFKINLIKLQAVAVIHYRTGILKWTGGKGENFRL